MEINPNLKQKIDDLLSNANYKDLKESTLKIIDNYINNKSSGESLLNKDNEALSYLSIRFPATYLATIRVIEEIKKLYNLNIDSLLDVGSGMGTSSLAFLDQFDIKKIDLIEREESMIKVGKELFSCLPNSISFNFIKEDYTKYEIKENYDVSIISYSLNELKESDIEIILKNMYLHTNKLLIIIDIGTPKGFNIINKSKEILKSFNPYVLAPCPNCIKCPLKEDDWCHNQVRVQRDKMAKLLTNADAPYEDEKFSYIVFNKDYIKPCGARILRHPNINKNNIELNLCTSEGNIKKVIYKNDKELYKRAKKAKMGDLFF